MQTKQSIRQAESKSIVRICIILSLAFLTMIGFCGYAFYMTFQIKSHYQPLLQTPSQLKQRLSKIDSIFNKELLWRRGNLTPEEQKAHPSDMNVAWKEFKEIEAELDNLNKKIHLKNYKKYSDLFFDLKNLILSYFTAKDQMVEHKKLAQINASFKKTHEEINYLTDSVQKEIDQLLQIYVVLFSVILTVNVVLFIMLLYFLIKYLKHQKKFNKLFQDQTNWLTHLLHALDAGVIAINSKGIITHWGNAAHKLFKVSHSEAVNHEFDKILPFLADYKSTVNALISAPVEKKFTKQKVVFKNKEMFLDLSFIPLSYEGNIHIVIEIIDMTESEIRDSHTRQAQQMEAVRNMMEGMANEFNNVLGILVNCVDVMRHSLDFNQEEFRKSYEETVDIIEDSTERATVMVKQMISLMLKQDMKRDKLNLNTLIKHVGKMCRHTVDSRISMDATPYTGKAMVNVDPQQLEMVIINMIDNASKAIEVDQDQTKKKWISISVEEESITPEFRTRFPEAKADHYWVIKISDTGIGISADIANKIFAPFFTSKGNFHGTGLGLTAANDIIRKLNGFVDYFSVPGKGTDFFIYLPEFLTDSEEIVIEEIEAKEKLMPTGKGTILVVDDEMNLCVMAKNILQTLGYDSIICENGFEAIEKFKLQKDNISMVFMDMLMPKLSGLEAYLEMKKVKPDVKAIIVSGYCGEDKKKASLEAGVNSFMTKPYSIQDLAKEIDKVLNPGA